MNKNQLSNFKEYEIIKPDIHKIDSIIDKCFRDCHNKKFHTFENKCIYDIKFTSIRKNEILKSTIPDREKNLYGLK